MNENTSAPTSAPLPSTQGTLPIGSPALDPIRAWAWAAKAPSETPWLHQEVAQRMAQRLEWITTPVQRWVHWEAVRGSWPVHKDIAQHLAQRFGRVESWVVESQVHHAQWLQQQRSATLVGASTPKDAVAGWLPWVKGRASDSGTKLLLLDAANGQELESLAAQMVWSNMGLHSQHDPLRTMRQWYTALAPGGYLMFSCLGPDTLLELRQRYRARGWGEPSQAFTDMHDWGDALQQAGFAEPVMDMERIVLTYSTAQAMVQDLRQLGRNLATPRPQALEPGAQPAIQSAIQGQARAVGLRARGWFKLLQEMLIEDKCMTFEIIYGHAFKPEQVRDRTTGNVYIGLEAMRHKLRGLTR